nr:MAG TPA: hypothetical protein [Herelleviridae sp.]
MYSTAFFLLKSQIIYATKDKILVKSQKIKNNTCNYFQFGYNNTCS